MFKVTRVGLFLNVLTFSCRLRPANSLHSHSSLPPQTLLAHLLKQLLVFMFLRRHFLLRDSRHQCYGTCFSQEQTGHAGNARHGTAGARAPVRSFSSPLSSPAGQRKNKSQRSTPSTEEAFRFPPKAQSSFIPPYAPALLPVRVRASGEPRRRHQRWGRGSATQLFAALRPPRRQRLPSVGTCRQSPGRSCCTRTCRGRSRSPRPWTAARRRARGRRKKGRSPRRPRRGWPEGR